MRSKEGDNHKLAKISPAAAWSAKNAYKGEYVFGAESSEKKKKMRKIVLTGAPYSGKTTVIDALRERGYPVISEAAIMVINAIHGLIPEGAVRWREKYLESFQYLISQKQYELENIPQNGEVLFLDRGAFDGYAFAMHFEKEFSEACKKLASKSKYDEVFLFDLVTPFDPRSDTGRIETEEDCRKLQVLLELAYYRNGYTPIDVPLMSVEDRVKFILGKIQGGQTICQLKLK